MDQINVRDLPEPLARAIEAMVETLRRQLAQTAPRQAARELPRWEGRVLGNLSRDEIYDDSR